MAVRIVFGISGGERSMDIQISILGHLENTWNHILTCEWATLIEFCHHMIFGFILKPENLLINFVTVCQLVFYCAFHVAPGPRDCMSGSGGGGDYVKLGKIF